MGLYSRFKNWLRPPRAHATAVGGDYWPGGGYSGLYGTLPAAGLRVGETEAMACSTAYACTRAISETLASISGIVYEQVSEGVRRRAPSHPMWSLLHDEPCPLMDSMQFYELGSTRVTNRGNFFAEIERDNADRPIALWPIHNSRVTAYWGEDGLEWHVMTNDSVEIKGSVYGYRYYVVPDRNMFNIVGFGALAGNGILASGVLPSAAEELSLDLAAQQYGASFFSQGGRPAGVVQHPGFIGDEKRRETFRRDINLLHSGRENWNKTAVLWEGATWKEMSVSPEQAQFIETRSYSARKICQYYNVPPAIVQIFDDYKFSTVDAMLRQFITLTIRPLAVRWERAIQRQLLSVRDVQTGRLTSIFNEDLLFEFLLNALLRGDPKQQAEVNKMHREMGTLNADEIRGQENLNPLPRGLGEAYIAPMNFTTLDRLVNGDTISGTTSTASTGASQSADGPKFDKQHLANLMLEAKEERDHKPTFAVGFEGEAEQTTAKESLRAALQETALRLVRVEFRAIADRVGKIKSVAEAREKYPQWLSNFYGGQLDRLRDALWPVALVASHDREAAIKAAAASAAAYCQRRTCEELDGLAACSDDQSWCTWAAEFAESVDGNLELVMSGEAAAIAKQIAEGL